MSAHYTSPFETPTTNPTARNPTGSGLDADAIKSQVVVDLQLGYIVDSVNGGWGSWLSETRWTVGATNLFDTLPALWTQPNRGFASPFVDSRMRYVYLQIGKSF